MPTACGGINVGLMFLTKSPAVVFPGQLLGFALNVAVNIVLLLAGPLILVLLAVIYTGPRSADRVLRLARAT